MHASPRAFEVALEPVSKTSADKRLPVPFTLHLPTGINRDADVSPVSIMTAGHPAGHPASEWTDRHQGDSPRPLLHDASLMAASSRIGDLIAARAGVRPIICLHGHPDRSRWQLVVKLPEQEHYIIVFQSDVLCLGKNLHPYEESLRMPFDEGVEWLLR